MEDSAGPEALGEQETRVFVYGTLKRGQSNHARLLGARWLGTATLEGACLYNLGPFPMAIAGEGRVCGELYAVPMAVLPLLDAYEGCPRLYQRHWLALADGRQAWVYLGQARQVRHVPRLAEGTWPSVPERRHSLSWQCLWPWGLGWALPLLCWLPAGAVLAGGFDTLGSCQAWRSSHGQARIALANAIGEAHALTKRRAFAESSPESPVALYDTADLLRVCSRP